MGKEVNLVAQDDKRKKDVAEEKKAAAEEEQQPRRPPPPLIIYVDLHCVGCTKKIERSILKIKGVEEVLINMNENQVTIKGVLDPEEVCTKINKKHKRMAIVISPLPAAESEPLPPIISSQASGFTTVELNVNMHCQGCADQLKKKILKMRGVQTTVADHTTGKVTVTGTMDEEKLVDYVYRRTKKQARIVPQETEEEDEEKPQETGEEEEEGGGEETEERRNGEMEAEEEQEEGMKRMMYYYYYQPLYVIDRVPPQQLFSDENPNACCIS